MSQNFLLDSQITKLLKVVEKINEPAIRLQTGLCPAAFGFRAADELTEKVLGYGGIARGEAQKIAYDFTIENIESGAWNPSSENFNPEPPEVFRHADHEQQVKPAETKAEPYRPESRDAGVKTAEERDYWRSFGQRKPESAAPKEFDAQKSFEALQRQLVHNQKRGMYCLTTYDRVWIKFGYTNDLGDLDDGARIKKHLKDGWDLRATKRGMDQQGDEKRIREALKRRGHEQFPGNNEVFRLTSELIQDAIDLGAPLPDSPMSLLAAKQLDLGIELDD